MIDSPTTPTMDTSANPIINANAVRDVLGLTVDTRALLLPDEADEGAGDSENFSQSITPNVEASLDDLLASEHAINVHESEENIENYIACGEITGSVSNGTLTIELQELNGSGLSGEAVLTEGADEGTSVTITLTQSGPSATPAATTRRSHGASPGAPARAARSRWSAARARMPGWPGATS